MAKSRSSKKTTPKGKKRDVSEQEAPQPLGWIARLRLRLRRFLFWTLAGVLSVVLGWTLLYAVINPPTTPYMFAEGRKWGAVSQTWVPMEDIAPVMARAVVAAEDANFCLHWGLDVYAIRVAAERGTGGASTISQQVVKNVFLWHGRSWARKSIEALWTPLAEAVWSKRRILEIYLNVAEFDQQVFGVQAAAQHYFGVNARDLSGAQAARLAAILPAPKQRSAADPSPYTRQRADFILDGAATIAADGRANCFETLAED